MSEFLSVEKNDSSATHGTLCSYYEINEMGEHILLWSYNSDTPVRDISIADMNGDTSPEIVVLARGGLVGNSKPWLKIFSWIDGIPSGQASASWGAASSRPTNLAIVDLDNNGRDEIAISMGSPNRGITLLSMGKGGLIEKQQSLAPGLLENGMGLLIVSPSDYNNDGLIDLVAISGEANDLRIQFYLNEGGLLKIDHSTSTTSRDHSISGGIIPSAISLIDSDFDGVKELVLPFTSAEALLVELSSGDEVVLREMEHPGINLFTLPNTGMETADINEILLARAETGVTQLRVRKVQLHGIELETEAKTSSSGVSSPVGRVREIQLQSSTGIKSKVNENISVEPTTDGPYIETDITPIELARVHKPQSTVGRTENKADGEVSSEPGTATSAVTSVTSELGGESEAGAQLTGETGYNPADLGRVRQLQLAAAETEGFEPRKVRKITLTTLKQEESSTLLPEDILPKGKTLSDTVYVGVEILIALLSEATQQLLGFSPDYFPEGAIFEPVEKMITWIPQVKQLGVRKMSYTVKFADSDQVEVEEIRGQSVTARSRETEETVELYFFVVKREDENGDIE